MKPPISALDLNLLEAGATLERTMTLAELGQLIKEHKLVVEVDSPDGFVPVTHFLHHGTRPCVRLTFDTNQTLECSIDHKLEVEGPDEVNDEHTVFEGGRYWLEAQWFQRNYRAKADCGKHFVSVLELEHVGDREVADLSIDHEASKGAHRFYVNGVSVHNCVNCGACDTIAEVKHVTTTPYKETGATDYWRIANVVRDNLTAQKLLVEARVKGGRHAAVQPRWLKYAITSALLRASDGELVEPNIQERFNDSRQGYRIKQDGFKSLISGSFLAEFQFSAMRRVRRHEDGTRGSLAHTRA
jgi:hypothetical protein